MVVESRKWLTECIKQAWIDLARLRKRLLYLGRKRRQPPEGAHGFGIFRHTGNSDESDARRLRQESLEDVEVLDDVLEDSQVSEWPLRKLLNAVLARAIEKGESLPMEIRPDLVELLKRSIIKKR